MFAHKLSSAVYVLLLSKLALLPLSILFNAKVDCIIYPDYDVTSSNEKSKFDSSDISTNSLNKFWMNQNGKEKKRLLTNAKFFYFVNDPRNYIESGSEQLEALPSRSDYGGYHEPHYKSIHIHSPQPVQYHGKEKFDKELWPLLLLSLLPVIASFLLLPFILTFYTQILQLLALMQNTMQNQQTTTTAASTLGLGRRRRRHISKVEVNYYPHAFEEMIQTIADRLALALTRFNQSNIV